MIYVCLSAEGIENAGKQLGEEKFAELRIDLVKPSLQEMTDFILRRKDVKFIVTCRPGVFDEETSMNYLRKAIDINAAYVDIEIERGAALSKELERRALDTDFIDRTQIIVSYHNYKSTPSKEELEELWTKMINVHRGDIAKIACMVNEPFDNARLLGMYNVHTKRYVVAFGMGELGKITRPASLLCGAQFTYAAPDFGSATAPGQFTVSQLKALYNTLK